MPGPDVPLADRLDQEFVRLRTITEMIENAVGNPTYEPDAISQWYRLWAWRRSTSLDRVKRYLAETEAVEAANAAREGLETILPERP